MSTVVTISSAGATIVYLAVYFANVGRIGHERALTRALPAMLALLAALLLLATP